MIKNNLTMYLLNEEKKYCINQEKIGWKQAFRGCTVKMWNNECKDKYFNYEVRKIVFKL